LLLSSGITDQFLQTDPDHSTGTVNVKLDSTGQPSFEIAKNSAWDSLAWTDDWRALAQSADAVCFGTLAQRSTQSRQTILNFLDATRPEILRIFDVNLRQNFYSAEIIRESLKRANVVKLNHEEVQRVAELADPASTEPSDFALAMLQEFNLQLVCVTRGENGSLLCDSSGIEVHPGFRVQIKDTVGAGDAFTAGLVHQLLRGSALPAMNDLANRMGAWIASSSGAMPPVPAEGLPSTLAQFQIMRSQSE
jgi:fructokinase